MITSVEQLIVMMNVITFVCTVAGVAALIALLWMALRRIDQTYVEAGADPAPLLALRSDAPKPWATGAFPRRDGIGRRSP